MSQTKVAAAAQLPPSLHLRGGFVETDTESSGSNDIWHVTSLCIITGVALLLCDRRSRYVLTLASIAFFGIEGTEQERVEFGYTSKQ